MGAALVGLNATGAEAERERAAHLSTGPDPVHCCCGPSCDCATTPVMIGRASVVPLPTGLADTARRTLLAKVSDAIVDYFCVLMAGDVANRGRARPAICAESMRRCSCYVTESRGAAQRRFDARAAPGM